MQTQARCSTAWSERGVVPEIEPPSWNADIGRHECFEAVDVAATFAAKQYRKRDTPSVRRELTHRIKVMDGMRGMPWGAP